MGILDNIKAAMQGADIKKIQPNTSKEVLTRTSAENSASTSSGESIFTRNDFIERLAGTKIGDNDEDREGGYGFSVQQAESYWELINIDKEGDSEDVLDEDEINFWINHYGQNPDPSNTKGNDDLTVSELLYTTGITPNSEGIFNEQSLENNIKAYLNTDKAQVVNSILNMAKKQDDGSYIFTFSTNDIEIISENEATQKIYALLHESLQEIPEGYQKYTEDELIDKLRSIELDENQITEEQARDFLFGIGVDETKATQLSTQIIDEDTATEFLYSQETICKQQEDGSYSFTFSTNDIEIISENEATQKIYALLHESLQEIPEGYQKYTEDELIDKLRSIELDENQITEEQARDFLFGIGVDETKATQLSTQIIDEDTATEFLYSQDSENGDTSIDATETTGIIAKAAANAASTITMQQPSSEETPTSDQTSYSQELQNQLQKINEILNGGDNSISENEITEKGTAGTDKNGLNGLLPEGFTMPSTNKVSVSAAIQAAYILTGGNSETLNELLKKDSLTRNEFGDFAKDYEIQEGYELQPGDIVFRTGADGTPLAATVYGYDENGKLLIVQGGQTTADGTSNGIYIRALDESRVTHVIPCGQEAKTESAKDAYSETLAEIGVEQNITNITTEGETTVLTLEDGTTAKITGDKAVVYDASGKITSGKNLTNDDIGQFLNEGKTLNITEQGLQTPTYKVVNGVLIATENGKSVTYNNNGEVQEIIEASGITTVENGAEIPYAMAAQQKIDELGVESSEITQNDSTISFSKDGIAYVYSYTENGYTHTVTDTKEGNSITISSYENGNQLKAQITGDAINLRSEVSGDLVYFADSYETMLQNAQIITSDTKISEIEKSADGITIYTLDNGIKVEKNDADGQTNIYNSDNDKIITMTINDQGETKMKAETADAFENINNSYKEELENIGIDSLITEINTDKGKTTYTFEDGATAELDENGTITNAKSKDGIVLVENGAEIPYAIAAQEKIDELGVESSEITQNDSTISFSKDGIAYAYSPDTNGYILSTTKEENSVTESYDNNGNLSQLTINGNSEGLLSSSAQDAVSIIQNQKDNFAQIGLNIEQTQLSQLNIGQDKTTYTFEDGATIELDENGTITNAKSKDGIVLVENGAEIPYAIAAQQKIDELGVESDDIKIDTNKNEIELLITQDDKTYIYNYALDSKYGYVCNITNPETGKTIKQEVPMNGGMLETEYDENGAVIATTCIPSSISNLNDQQEQIMEDAMGTDSLKEFSILNDDDKFLENLYNAMDEHQDKYNARHAKRGIEWYTNNGYGIKKGSVGDNGSLEVEFTDGSKIIYGPMFGQNDKYYTKTKISSDGTMTQQVMDTWQELWGDQQQAMATISYNDDKITIDSNKGYNITDIIENTLSDLGYDDQGETKRAIIDEVEKYNGQYVHIEIDKYTGAVNITKQKDTKQNV